VITIADEVMCGFCRTGRMFCIDHWDVVPDMMAMSKGITSGYLPFGAVAIGCLVVLQAFAASAAAPAEPKRESSFDRDWRFLKGDATGAENAVFDDSAWRGCLLFSQPQLSIILPVYTAIVSILTGAGWMLGGLAVARAPRRPWPQFVTVAGGPLVNVVIFGILSSITYFFFHIVSLNPLFPLVPNLRGIPCYQGRRARLSIMPSGSCFGPIP